ncbi:alpha/beta hydrolase [Stagnihabitans tardus]|uniref:Prolyl oligopeptidase family serine peptidase n=1 Tax=Stagnihabitans tardus TaxID=2699202 RepID=A0AAE4Y5I9_9RHOB|nr:prolyl oligopeptidase family serine peptidase [Stagnihabitans tardus]
MSRILRFGRKAAANGQAKSLVVFVHGYGADGSDLLSLGDVLGDHLPDTAFVAPDAPEAIPGAPFGRQWFGIPRFDGTSEERARAGLAASSEDLNAFIDQRAGYEGIGADRVVVVGFSQGAMLSFNAIPMREAPVAAVVAISGQLLHPPGLAVAVSKPPFLVMHGDEDEVVPFASMAEACNALVENGFPTYGHVMEGTGHGIAQDGLAQMLGFIRQVLGG